MTCTLNRRLKRTSPLPDAFLTRAKLPSLINPPEAISDSLEIKTEEAEDSGFCEASAQHPLPMILLESRDKR